MTHKLDKNKVRSNVICSPSYQGELTTHQAIDLTIDCVLELLKQQAMVESEPVANVKFELDQLTEEFIAELDDETVLIISGGNRGKWAQQFNAQKSPQSESARIAELEAKLKVAIDAIKFAQENITHAEGNREYYRQSEYYLEAFKQIG
jgi:hypothetical protein